jgi:asparagine synthase (glutamine-hydrolysing)
MCGYFGAVNSNVVLEKKLLKSYLNYRGPDEQNVYDNDNIFIIHNRLKIIDLKGGQQPIKNNNGNILSYNGEIYNFKKIQKEFLNCKVNFTSDTELLFYLLNNIGVERTCEIIDGMYSFYFYEKKTNASYLCRDISGQKPIYYFYENNELIFSSEILPIFKIKKNLDISIENIKKYLMMDYFPREQTIFSKIKKVLPGHIYKFRDNCIKKIGFKNKLSLKNDINKNNSIDDILRTSINDCLISDVPIGVLLSGGIDSSLISVIANEYKKDIPTFSMTFENKSYDESEYINFLTKEKGLNNKQFKLSESDMKIGMNEVLSKLDEPFSDPSLISTYLISKFAKQYVKVALTGDGADELFGGYPNFRISKLSKIISLFPNKLSEIIRKIINNNIQNSEKYMNIGYLLKQISFGLGKKPMFQSNYFMSTFSEDDLTALYNSSFNEKEVFEDINDLFLDYETDDNINRTQHIFFNSYLPDNILFKSDRCSMYNSLELRAPFLTNAMISFSSQLKSSKKTNLLNNKIILKKLSKKYLPKKIIERKKHGFALPLKNLITNNFSSIKSEIIENKKLDFLNLKVMNEILENKSHNIINNQKKIWSLFILSKVLNKYN